MAYMQKIENKRLSPCCDNPTFNTDSAKWTALKRGEPVFVPDGDVDYHLNYFGGCIKVVEVVEEATEPEDSVFPGGEEEEDQAE